MTTEYEGLRLQYIKLQDKYNDIVHDTPTRTKEIPHEKISSFRETEAVPQYGDSLFDEIQRMKRDVSDS